MSEIIYKEVEFWRWCPKCKYEKLEEKEDPCCECLDSFFNFETNKPEKFEEKENGQQ